MQNLLGKHWHHLPVDEVTQLLDTNAEKGLDLFETQHRQQRFGLNVITPPKGKSPLVRFLLQFHNPLIYILLLAGVVTATVKREPVDALIILGAVLVNAIIGYVQESRAEKAIEALQKTMQTEATVIRAGKSQRLPASQLVPGDLVLLKSGDRVPADMRLVRVKDLQVAEAALTGESAPVQKDTVAPLAPETGLADRRNMVYTSTLVTYGQGYATVIATGDSTEIGRISTLIASSESLETPLTRKIASFSRVLLYAILGLAGIAFITGVLRGQNMIETFTAAIALAVAAIPEGLPPALTVTLAIGVARMARRRAVIRKLPAVETLGSVTVICSDKTGTLTQNEMTIKEIWAGGQAYQVSGGGYEPEGQVMQGEHPVESTPGSALHESLLAGLLCNDSRLSNENGKWEVHGDPTEVALVVSAYKAGLKAEEVSERYPRLDEIPFESQHQYMATLHANGAAGSLIFVKGAAEAVLERCDAALDEHGRPVALDRDMIEQQVAALASHGMRVLGLARKAAGPAIRHITHADVTGGMTFLGLQGMIDPPRSEAIAAVLACQGAGIKVKMITGDHALTASAIARQLNMVDPDGLRPGQREVLTGRELEKLSDEELIHAAQTVNVFARVSPEQKLRLVEALQARGEVVAMTGDGVNDGPALKQANIGIAMGITGTDVAKEAADMILTDDNFATITAAVEEGRGVFDNLTKMIAWTLPTNIGQGLTILAAVLLGVVMPVLPGQILWINLVSVVVLGLVLAMEPKEKDIMRRRPRNPRSPVLTRGLLWRTLFVGMLIMIGAFGMFELELMSGSSVEAARTAAINTIIVIEMFYLLNTRTLYRPATQAGFFTNPYAAGGLVLMTLLQLLFTYAPFMNNIFNSAPVAGITWLKIVVIGLAVFLIIEVEKWLARRTGAGGQGKRTAEEELRKAQPA